MRSLIVALAWVGPAYLMPMYFPWRGAGRCARRLADLLSSSDADGGGTFPRGDLLLLRGTESGEINLPEHRPAGRVDEGPRILQAPLDGPPLRHEDLELR